MDLARVGAALWRHKFIMTLGILVGAGLAVLTLYRVAPNSSGQGVRLEDRAVTQYKAEADLIVDTPGFGIGRADDTGRPPADVASVYSYLAVSAPVQDQVRAKLGDLGVTLSSSTVPKTPVVQILGTGGDRARATQVVDATAKAFIAYLGKLQADAAVPPGERMVVHYFNQPQVTQQKSRQTEMALLAFVLPVLAAFGLALSAENVKRHRQEKAAAEADLQPELIPDAPGMTAAASIAGQEAGGE